MGKYVVPEWQGWERQKLLVSWPLMPWEGLDPVVPVIGRATASELTKFLDHHVALLKFPESIRPFVTLIGSMHDAAAPVTPPSLNWRCGSVCRGPRTTWSGPLVPQWSTLMASDAPKKSGAWGAGPGVHQWTLQLSSDVLPWADAESCWDSSWPASIRPGRTTEALCCAHLGYCLQRSGHGRHFQLPPATTSSIRSLWLRLTTPMSVLETDDGMVLSGNLVFLIPCLDDLIPICYVNSQIPLPPTVNQFETLFFWKSKCQKDQKENNGNQDHGSSTKL